MTNLDDMPMARLLHHSAGHYPPEGGRYSG